ncbi:hypothetical protein D1007_32429 [Hordeum vulgare]|nr:hypothetical protein D1007_32429 [Hordeum vulgare]
MVTAPAGPNVRHHNAGAGTAAIDPADHEKQASYMHPSMQREGRTAIASPSHAHMERVNAQATLPMAGELLCERPLDAVYDAWLTRITQLITIAGGSPDTLSLAPSPFFPRQ